MPFAAAQKSSESIAGDVSRFDAPAEKKAPSPFAWLFVVSAVTFAYMYTSLFSVAAGAPHLRSGDEGFFWTYASRLLSGQVFLKDFHQFTPPGTDLVYAAVFRAFGANVRSIDWTILGVGVALAMACFLCARCILRADMAALAALVCVVVLYGDRMDATHHWFSSMANLMAALLLLRGSSRLRIAGAAALIAIAASFTQTAGAVGLLACCTGLIWEKRTGHISSRIVGARMAALAGMTMGVWLLLSGRFIVQAGVRKYWFEQVASLPRNGNFPAGFLVPHFSASLHSRSLIGLADHMLVYALLLAVCPWVASLCWRRRIGPGENSLALVLLATLGILQMLEVITVLNWNRMSAVAMPSVILGVWLLTRTGAAGRRWAAACACIVGAMIAVQSGATQMRRFPQLKLPGGDALLEKDDVDEVAWLVTHTRPGDCFFEVGNTRYYVPLALRNPTPVDVLSASNVTPPEWVSESVQGLRQYATQYILWEPHTGIGRVEQRHQANNDHLDPLRAFVREEYVRVSVFENGDEMWERRY
jgi:hypothetical protein